MTTYRTGNPIGSTDPKDLYDNAENTDVFVNSLDREYWDDRFGRNRKTIYGMYQDFQEFLVKSGYVGLGPNGEIQDYAAGLEITERNQVFRYEGELYRAGAALDLPYTTTGDWGAEGSLFVAVGDSSLRDDLSNTFDPLKGADLIPTVPRMVDSISALKNLPKNGNPWSYVAGYNERGDGGGGFYYLDINSSPEEDNGGSVISALDGGVWKLIHDGSVSVKQFGAMGDGLDSTSAIKSASLDQNISELVFPPGLYKYSSGLIVEDRKSWVGVGGQRSTTLERSADDAIIQMNTLSQIHNINIDGGGFRGDNLQIAEGHSHRINSIRSVNCAGNPLRVKRDAGSGSSITDFEGYPTDPLVHGGIYLESDSNPIVKVINMDGIWLSGCSLILQGNAGNGSSVSNFYVRRIVTDLDGFDQNVRPGLIKFSNGRCANLGEDIPLTLVDSFFSSVVFAGHIKLINCQGVSFAGSCQFGSISEDDSSRYNTFFTQATAYTPTWTQQTGNPSIGNGTLRGMYSRSGQLVNVNIEFIAGSTTNGGSAGEAWEFSLPFLGRQAINQRGALFEFGGTSEKLICSTLVSENSRLLRLERNGQYLRNEYPIPLSQGVGFRISFSYFPK